MEKDTRRTLNLVTLGWIGGISLYSAVLILTIAVAVRDRPAAAPADVTGDFGWTAVGNPTFLSGLAASTVIFISSSGHSANIPMIAEVGIDCWPTHPWLWLISPFTSLNHLLSHIDAQPEGKFSPWISTRFLTQTAFGCTQEYKKPIAACMALLNVSYLVFSLVIFRFCGRALWSLSC